MSAPTSALFAMVPHHRMLRRLASPSAQPPPKRQVPQAIPLRNWSAVLSGDDYTAPEQRFVCLVGERPDGKRVCTSAVVRWVCARTYRTRSGTLYRLTGEADPDYLRSLNGRRDHEDPVFFRGDPLRAWFLGDSDRRNGHPYRLEASVLDYFGLKASDIRQEDRLLLRTRYHEGFHGTCDRRRKGQEEA